MLVVIGLCSAAIATALAYRYSSMDLTFLRCTDPEFVYIDKVESRGNRVRITGGLSSSMGYYDSYRFRVDGDTLRVGFIFRSTKPKPESSGGFTVEVPTGDTVISRVILTNAYRVEKLIGTPSSEGR